MVSRRTLGEGRVGTGVLGSVTFLTKILWKLTTFSNDIEPSILSQHGRQNPCIVDRGFLVPVYSSINA